MVTLVPAAPIWAVTNSMEEIFSDSHQKYFLYFLQKYFLYFLQKYFLYFLRPLSGQLPTQWKRYFLIPTKSISCISCKSISCISCDPYLGSYQLNGGDIFSFLPKVFLANPYHTCSNLDEFLTIFL